jgi:hypothetical protein
MSQPTESAGHYVLDYADHGRLTHAPSGDTLVRRGWMRADEWAGLLSAFAAAHPGATEVRDVRRRHVGDLRDVPCLGGAISKGDRFLTVDAEGEMSSRSVVGSRPDGHGDPDVHVLEDGQALYWDDSAMLWMTGSTSAPDTRTSARRLRDPEPDPGLSTRAVLGAFLAQAAVDMEGDREFHLVAGRIPELERRVLGQTFKALRDEATDLSAEIDGTGAGAPDELDRGADLVARLSEFVREVKDHPQASPAVGNSIHSGVGRLLMRADAVAEILSNSGYVPARDAAFAP